MLMHLETRKRFGWQKITAARDSAAGYRSRGSGSTNGGAGSLIWARSGPIRVRAHVRPNPDDTVDAISSRIICLDWEATQNWISTETVHANGWIYLCTLQLYRLITILPAKSYRSGTFDCHKGSKKTCCRKNASTTLPYTVFTRGDRRGDRSRDWSQRSIAAIGRATDRRDDRLV